MRRFLALLALVSAVPHAVASYVIGLLAAASRMEWGGAIAASMAEMMVAAGLVALACWLLETERRDI